MRFLLEDHLARVLLEEDGAALDELQQVPVEGEPVSLVLEGILEDVAQIVAVGLQERADRQRRLLAQLGDLLSGVLRVRQRLGRLIPQPGNDRYPAMFFKSLITEPTPVLSEPATFDVHGPRRSARSSRRHIGHSWAQHPIRLSKNHWR